MVSLTAISLHVHLTIQFNNIQLVNDITKQGTMNEVSNVPWEFLHFYIFNTMFASVNKNIMLL